MSPSPGTRRKRWILAVLLGLLGLELTCRVFWKSTQGIPIFRPGRLVQLFYPQLKRFHHEPEREGAAPEQSFEVLILGASVLHEEFGSFEPLFRAALEERTDRPITLYNLATPAHTSRDSRLKYFYAIEEHPVDLVVVYHNINELRANNCPPEVFREDYGHYAFNRLVNAYFDHPLLLASSLVASTYYGVSRVGWKLGWIESIPRGRPNPEWLEYGGDIRTEACLRRNLGAIIDDARARDIPVLLMSYANYIPDDYTLERFLDRELDYGTFRLPIELWGTVEHVRKGLVVHNAALLDLARSKDCLFVDQNALIEKNGANFNDICHLSDPALEEFARNMASAIEPLLQ